MLPALWKVLWRAQEEKQEAWCFRLEFYLGGWWDIIGSRIYLEDTAAELIEELLGKHEREASWASPGVPTWAKDCLEVPFTEMENRSGCQGESNALFLNMLKLCRVQTSKWRFQVSGGMYSWNHVHHILNVTGCVQASACCGYFDLYS